MQRSILTGVALGLIGSTAHAGVRDIQITQIDLESEIVTLTNVGGDSQSLVSYRMCTADEGISLRYSTLPINITLAPGETAHIHWNNDAVAANEFNIASLGGNAVPNLDHGPLGVAVYWATPFSMHPNMADYVQMTDDLANPGNLTADARGGTALAAGLWTGGATDWVVLNDDTTLVTLNDLSGAEAHDATSYDVNGGADPCPEDVNGDGIVGFSDVVDLLANWGPCRGCPQDVNGNDDVGFSDLVDVLSAWGDCP